MDPSPPIHARAAALGRRWCVAYLVLHVLDRPPTDGVGTRADLDGDGIDEALTAEGWSIEEIRWIDGRIESRDVGALPYFSEIEHLLARDLDGDGWEDVLVTVRADEGVDLALLRGLGDGALADPVTLLAATPRAPSWTLHAGDLDGDGLDEIVFSGGSDGSIRVLWPEADGGWRVDEGPGREAVILGEERSLIVLDGLRLRRLSTREGRLGEPVTVRADSRFEKMFLRFAADVDADGDTDLAVWEGGPKILRADEGALIEALQVPRSLALPALVDDLDGDGDGRPDLVLLDAPYVSGSRGIEVRLSGGAT